MTLKVESKMRYNFKICDEDLTAIKNFLQGAVYCWIKNKEDELFAVRDLMGGENFDWDRTPLYCLYKKHKKLGKDNNGAIKEAGKDLGWILKLVLKDDKRLFESCDKGMTKGYKWVK